MASIKTDLSTTSNELSRASYPSQIFDPNYDVDADDMGEQASFYAFHSSYSIQLSYTEDSPYPEVRSAVANSDDPLMVRAL